MKKIAVVFILFLFVSAHGDILVLDNGKRVQGTMTEIADEYIEFKAELEPGNVEWLKVYKKDLLAVINQQGKLAYPRDKYDENSLNWGRVPIRSSRDKQVYLQRKKQNLSRQQELELRERDKYKVAALVGSLSGIMLWALIDNN